MGTIMTDPRHARSSRRPLALVALEPVVGDRLPWCGGREVRAPGRPHSRIAIERAEPDAHLRVVIRVAREQLRSALPAEQLLEAAVRMPPGLDELLAGD